MKKLSMGMVVALLAFQSFASVIVFRDTFNADLGGTNPNTDVNIGTASRQSGGTTATTYTETNLNTGNAFLNTPGGGPFSGQTVLLLRTSSTAGASASTAGVKTDSNFASVLAGKKYEIAFRGAIEVGGTPSTDYWGGFYLTDGLTATGPNAAATRYGFLYRERDANNFTFWKDGVGTTSTVADEGTSYFNAATLFTFNITVDEVAGTVDTIINQGLANEITLAQRGIAFANSTDRYFGFRANQGGATGLADFRYDNFDVTVIPEPATLGMVTAMGAGVLFIRRRFMI